MFSNLKTIINRSQNHSTAPFKLVLTKPILNQSYSGVNQSYLGGPYLGTFYLLQRLNCKFL